MSDSPSPGNREPALRTVAMPADANPNGDIFGGWLMAQMDLAGSVVAVRRARGRVVTVAVEAMSFHRPVMVGDLVSCYAHVVRIGRTSLTVEIDTWVERLGSVTEKVTEGVFTYVAVDADGQPRPVSVAP
ncbi:acyl-CoA thioesterase [Rhodospirillaceae bacterium SYSU D60014]|uniref:acyl-CoA thioesterase n=1 Tax=Virgifigura deserti TaxID=2268457 RepID=UPI000E674BEC